MLAEGLDVAKAREIRRRICRQAGISERTPYAACQRPVSNAGFEGLMPKGKSKNRSSGAIPPHILEQAILLCRYVPSRSIPQIIHILEWRCYGRLSKNEVGHG